MIRPLSAVVFLLLGLPGNSSDAPATTAVNPPKVTVLQNSPGLSDGLIFIAPKGAGIGGGPQPGPVGPEIVDSNGRVIWFSPVTNGQVAADFRVQSYRGKPVLTWAQQSNFGKLAGDTSVNYIADDTYHVIATVRPATDSTPMPMISCSRPKAQPSLPSTTSVTADLSSVGGSKNAQVWEGSIQEIDVATGKVIFEWHSLARLDSTRATGHCQTRRLRPGTTSTSTASRLTTTATCCSRRATHQRSTNSTATPAQ
jgi:hypothetical protein